MKLAWSDENWDVKTQELWNWKTEELPNKTVKTHKSYKTAFLWSVFWSHTSQEIKATELSFLFHPKKQQQQQKYNVQSTSWETITLINVINGPVQTVLL